MFRQDITDGSPNVRELMSGVNGRVFQVRADGGDITSSDIGLAGPNQHKQI